SKDAFLNSFSNFSNSNELFRALVPAALFPFSICNVASSFNVSNEALIFSINSFMVIILLRQIFQTFSLHRNIFLQTNLLLFLIFLFPILYQKNITNRHRMINRCIIG